MSFINVDHLVKKFKEVTAVNDVSFEVKKGDIFAFLGPGGAGKTTTIKRIIASSKGIVFRCGNKM